jgi:GntR family transcriptional regulator
MQVLCKSYISEGGSDDELAYMRMANDIESRMKSGELRPGARLLPERELATYYGVAYLTVRRAMKVLRERGLINTMHGRGTFVADRQG